ncbi:unnamed protein product, partial [Prorocentrum cordatum]
GDRAGKLRWRGLRYDDGCRGCSGDEVSACNRTLFEDTRMHCWMGKAGCLVMWIADYSRKTMLQELSHIDHKLVDRQISKFRQTTSDWHDVAPPQTIKSSFKEQGDTVRQQPAAARPAATKSQGPSAMKKSPTTKITTGKSDKPRGHEEMLKNVSLLSLQKGGASASDMQGAIISAVKALRRLRGLTKKTPPHELVNHGAVEIVSERGFSTNAIAARWSALARWARSRRGGRLPSHSSRGKRRCIENEFQA